MHPSPSDPPAPEPDAAGPASDPLTSDLAAAAAGEDGAADRLYARVYAELRRLAGLRMAAEGRPHTLQATALVHEAWLRLGADGTAWESRGHFYSAAAEAMRRILIDHARRRGAQRRGGGLLRLPAGVLELLSGEKSDEILAVDDALRRLKGVYPRAAEIVNLRFYAGLSIAEAAQALGLSERTVAREWTFARAWLYNDLAPELGDGSRDPTETT